MTARFAAHLQAYGSSLEARERRCRMLAVIGLTVAVLMSSSAPAIADHACRGDRWPAFRDVAQTAKRIVVGTVVEGEGGMFRLRIDEVLRGSAPEMMRIDQLRSGLPRRADPGCSRGSVLLASFGDRIAIAFRGRSPGTEGRVTSAAWIEGRPSRSFNPGLERLTLARVRRLAGHAADGTTLPPDKGITRTPVGLAGLVGRISGALAGLDRTIRDTVARHACVAVLTDIPRMVVRSGEPKLAAAYGMTGPELSEYFAFRAQMLGDERAVPVSTGWRGVAGMVTACFIDGDLEVAVPSAAGWPAKRILVLIDDRRPTLWQFASDRRGQLPLLFDFLR